MSYRVLLPAAGTGSRLGEMTRFLNKSLVSIAHRPVISHIIEQFPSTADFVVALGYKGQLLREFLTLAYPQRKFYFVQVNPFEGPDSGLGLSILCCQEHLQQPFVFISCDTLVKESIPPPDHNWMGYADMEEIAPYRTIEINSGVVEAVCEKGEGIPRTHKPYLGLAGVKDFRLFWEAMEKGGRPAVAGGEAFGMRRLLSAGITPYRFTWFDTGNPQALSVTREAYREPGGPNILEKANESIWFIGDAVIKYSDDQQFIKNRVARAAQLKDYIPEVTGASTHMFRCVKVPGTILSECVTLPMFKDLLRCAKGFWTTSDLDDTERAAFRKSCLRFYKEKTEERVALFFKTFQKDDTTGSINTVAMPTLGSLLDSIDWKWIADGIPGRFHGDFHFENILYDDAQKKFIFLDWRQDFGNSLTTGDVYYDLAKLLHGLIVCHELIAAGHYHVDWRPDGITFDLHRKQILVECEHYFSSWLEENGYDRRKVWILTALVYLNIAALHHYPYSLLLFALGKYMLFHELR